ncbi:MAG TPA: HIG1 domain-containing protein [Burkholderiaceae bacterium]|nr:HIG1 domain-containing protein [Burkholderiaceae bacterium]HRP29292.1 HIG1 domain-containing protein [Burkholderiaceae bacterium]
MNIMTFFVVLAASCVLVSLVLGISAMVHHGNVGHRSSDQWMSARVGFQGLALALILVALLTG